MSKDVPNCTNQFAKVVFILEKRNFLLYFILKLPMNHPIAGK